MALEHQVTVVEEGTTSDQRLAIDLSRTLTGKYPGHPWGVFVDSKAGYADIMNFDLSAKSGYRFKIGDLQTPEEIKRRAMIAGGEILERHNVARGRADRDQLRHLSQKADFK